MSDYIPINGPMNIKVKSGFGLSKNEANLKHSASSIGDAHALANSWTEPKQGMSIFPMNRADMMDTRSPLNRPQTNGNAYPTIGGIKATNLKVKGEIK